MASQLRIPSPPQHNFPSRIVHGLSPVRNPSRDRPAAALAPINGFSTAPQRNFPSRIVHGLSPVRNPSRDRPAAAQTPIDGFSTAPPIPASTQFPIPNSPRPLTRPQFEPRSPRRSSSPHRRLFNRTPVPTQRNFQSRIVHDLSLRPQSKPRSPAAAQSPIDGFSTAPPVPAPPQFPIPNSPRPLTPSAI